VKNIIFAVASVWVGFNILPASFHLVANSTHLFRLAWNASMD